MLTRRLWERSRKFKVCSRCASGHPGLVLGSRGTTMKSMASGRCARKRLTSRRSSRRVFIPPQAQPCIPMRRAFCGRAVVVRGGQARWGPLGCTQGFRGPSITGTGEWCTPSAVSAEDSYGECSVQHHRIHLGRLWPSPTCVKSRTTRSTAATRSRVKTRAATWPPARTSKAFSRRARPWPWKLALILWEGRPGRVRLRTDLAARSTVAIVRVL